MSAVATNAFDPALVAALVETLPSMRALNPKRNANLSLPYANLHNIMKSLKLLFTVLILCKEMGCIRAVRRILWIVRASMTLSGFCYH